MKWSWKIGHIAGVELRMHVTFLALIAWLAASYWMTAGMKGVLAGVGFILAIFLCVVLHELGHALTARQFAIRTLDITLLPIGGLARLERLPEEPSHELWIALAGPAVNLAIAACLDSWLTFMNNWQPLSQLHLTTGPWIERLLVVNVSLVLFNFIPAFPMDGGRVLRALLTSRMGHTRATEVAAGVGQVLAFVIGLIGLLVSPMLLLIGLFVWIGASQEAAAAQLRSALSDTPTRAVMLTNFATLEPGDTLVQAVRLTLNGSQRDFPVVDEGKVAGMVTGIDLLAALASHGLYQAVTFAMRRDCLIVGLITMENIQEYLLIRATLKEQNRRAQDIRHDASAGLAGGD